MGHSLRCHGCGASCPVCAASMRRAFDRQADHHVDICDGHGTWFDGCEPSAFLRAFSELRAGEVDDADLAAAGIPGGVARGSEGSFFSDLWHLMFPRHRRRD